MNTRANFPKAEFRYEVVIVATLDFIPSTLEKA